MLPFSTLYRRPYCTHGMQMQLHRHAAGSAQHASIIDTLNVWWKCPKGSPSTGSSEQRNKMHIYTQHNTHYRHTALICPFSSPRNSLLPTESTPLPALYAPRLPRPCPRSTNTHFGEPTCLLTAPSPPSAPSHPLFQTSFPRHFTSLSTPPASSPPHLPTTRSPYPPHPAPASQRTNATKQTLPHLESTKGNFSSSQFIMRFFVLVLLFLGLVCASVWAADAPQVGTVHFVCSECGSR